MKSLAQSLNYYIYISKAIFEPDLLHKKENFRLGHKFSDKNDHSPVHLIWDLIQSGFFRKLQVLDQVHFKKNYNDWINCKLPSSRTKWTGLRLVGKIGGKKINIAIAYQHLPF